VVSHVVSHDLFRRFVRGGNKNDRSGKNYRNCSLGGTHATRNKRDRPTRGTTRPRQQVSDVLRLSFRLNRAACSGRSTLLIDTHTTARVSDVSSPTPLNWTIYEHIPEIGPYTREPVTTSLQVDLFACTAL